MYAVGGQGWTAVIHFFAVVTITNICTRFFRFVYVEGARAPKEAKVDKAKAGEVSTTEAKVKL